MFFKITYFNWPVKTAFRGARSVYCVSEVREEVKPISDTKSLKMLWDFPTSFLTSLANQGHTNMENSNTSIKTPWLSLHQNYFNLTFHSLNGEKTRKNPLLTFFFNSQVCNKPVVVLFTVMWKKQNKKHMEEDALVKWLRNFLFF